MNFKSALFCVLLCAVSAPLPAAAKTTHADYVTPNVADLTKFSGSFNVFDLKDPETFKQYLKISDCDVAASLKNSPFKYKEVQQSVLKAMAVAPKANKPLYIRLPITLQVSDYNFETQSLPIIPQSQFKRVNILELTSINTPLCTQENTSDFKKVPGYYMTKLNFPISLYRIPVQRDVAESLFSKLNRYGEEGITRLLYGYMLVEIETIQPVVQNDSLALQILTRGQVNAIDLYIDKGRKVFFKTLDYSQNY